MLLTLIPKRDIIYISKKEAETKCHILSINVSMILLNFITYQNSSTLATFYRTICKIKKGTPQIDYNIFHFAIGGRKY